MKRDYVKTGLKVASTLGISSLSGGAIALIGTASPCGWIFLGCRILAGTMLSSAVTRSIYEEIDGTVDLACEITDDLRELYNQVSVKG